MSQRVPAAGVDLRDAGNVESGTAVFEGRSGPGGSAKGLLQGAGMSRARGEEEVEGDEAVLLVDSRGRKR